MKVVLTSFLAVLFTAALFFPLNDKFLIIPLFGLILINLYWGNQIIKRLQLKSLGWLPLTIACLVVAASAMILLIPESIKENSLVQIFGATIFGVISLSYAALAIIMSFILSGGGGVGRRALVFVLSAVSFQFMCVGVFFISARLKFLEKAAR